MWPLLALLLCMFLSGDAQGSTEVAPPTHRMKHLTVEECRKVLREKKLNWTATNRRK